MNPYKQSDSSPTKQPAASNTIDWLVIFQAGAVYFVSSFICALIFSNAIGTISTNADVVYFAILTVLLWIVGAVYLARNVTDLWVLHGLTYSLIPPLALFINVASITGVLYPPLWISMLFWQLGSTATVLVTIALVRLLFRA